MSSALACIGLEVSDEAKASIVAAVRTSGFTADLRLAGSDHLEMPAPGNIISGTVFLSAAIDCPFLNAAQA